jgi:hypothetical protein
LIFKYFSPDECLKWLLNFFYAIATQSEDRSLDTQLPAGEGDEKTITLEVVAKNKGGKSKAARVKVKSEAKTFNEDDFEDIADKMKNLQGEGNERSSLSFGLAVISSAKVRTLVFDLITHDLNIKKQQSPLSE